MLVLVCDFVIEACVNSDLPNLTITHCVPVEFLDVHKDPHQLGDGHGRMSVVQLDGDLENATQRLLLILPPVTLF